MNEGDVIAPEEGTLASVISSTTDETYETDLSPLSLTAADVTAMMSFFLNVVAHDHVFGSMSVLMADVTDEVISVPLVEPNGEADVVQTTVIRNGSTTETVDSGCEIEVAAS